MFQYKSFNCRTCLSPTVEKLFQKSVTKSIESCLLPGPGPLVKDSTVNQIPGTYILDWQLIHGAVSDVERKYQSVPLTYQDYGKALENLAPFLNFVMQTYKNFSLDEISEPLEWLNWTHCEQVFSHCWKLLLKQEDDCDVVLATLLLTAYFEHALGNVYLIKGKNVPFLMKDLLATEELLDILGHEPVQVLKLIMGTPKALNLRNVVWHGFLSPTEIDARYGYFLIAAAVTLGVHLQTQYDSIPKRKKTSFESSKVLKDFPEGINFNVLKRIFADAHILPQMKTYFSYSTSLFEQRRYGECMALLLPSIECMLRCLYATFNNCPERILTAENDVFYTTFDEILSQWLPNKEDNTLLQNFHGHLFEMFLDLLNYQQGPRVRDRISHGEVQLDLVPKELPSHLLHLTACVCLQLSHNQLEDPYVSSIAGTPFKYKAHFHPTSLLCSKVNELLLELLCWEHIPQALNGSVLFHVDVKSLKCFRDFLYDIGVYDITSLKTYFVLLEKVQLRMQSLTVLTLFRPRQELEAVCALQQIATNILKASSNIRNSLMEKHCKLLNKELRSRQRENYNKMQNKCAEMYGGLIHLSLLLLCFSKSINEIGKLNVKVYRLYLKFFKKALQLSENLVVLSGRDNNDWNRITELQRQFLLVSSNFNVQFPLSTNS